MRLSELFKLSPLAWEKAKRETIKQHNLDVWDDCVKSDDQLSFCFIFAKTKNTKMWCNLEFHNDIRLLKKWEVKQTGN